MCDGIPRKAFIDYFQMSETTSRRCVSHLMRGIVCCSALAGVYLRKPTKLDAVNIVALHDCVNDIHV